MAPPNSDRVAALAATLNNALVPVARLRLAAMGEKASGAGNFYAVRIARGDLFADYDRALATALIDRLGGRFTEVGGGWGTLSWLLAGLGAKVSMIEHSRQRVAAAEAMLAAAARALPEIGRNMRVVAGSFPDVGLPFGGVTAIATNLVFTTTPDQRRRILRAFAAHPAAIVDIDRFLEKTGPDARPETLATFAAAGMTGEPYLDMGRSACFWRFRG